MRKLYLHFKIFNLLISKFNQNEKIIIFIDVYYCLIMDIT